MTFFLVAVIAYVVLDRVYRWAFGRGLEAGYELGVRDGMTAGWTLAISADEPDPVDE